QICNNKCRVTFSEHDSEITKDGKVIGRGNQAHASHKAKNIVSITRCLELLHMDLFSPFAIRSYGGNRYNLVIVDDYSRKIKESLNVTFDETPPPSKTSPLVEDDLDEEEAIKVTEKKILENDIEDETLEIDEIVNIKESRNHPFKNVIGNLNQNQTNFFCFISTIEPKNVNEALTDESRLVAQGYNQQEGMDYDETYALISRLESITILLAYACALDFKLFQMDVKSAFLNGFINEEVYVAQPSGFIDFEKPDHVYKLNGCLCTRFKRLPKPLTLKRLSVSFNTLKGLWYPKGTSIETIVYADSDHVGDYVNRKSTSGICTFAGWCLTSWFSKKQTALAISTIEAKYVSAKKACQQALWMKQALIDYDVRLDNVPIMCDNKGTIDLSKNPVQHSRTKHIKIRHHFLCDNVQKGHMSIEKVSSIDNITDILTKLLKRESLNYLHLGLGMMEHIP
ncbi:copia protein, partial [Tanacetum coccineum]